MRCEHQKGLLERTIRRIAVVQRRMPQPSFTKYRRLTFFDLPPECKLPVLWEFCTQFGEVEDIHVPWRDGASGAGDSRTRCFVTFTTIEDAKYCFEVLRRGRVKLYGKELDVRHDIPVEADSSLSVGMRRSNIIDLYEIGAKLFIDGLPRGKSKYELTTFFEQFGPFAAPIRMLTDKEGNFKGKAIVSYCDFAVSDRVVMELHGKDLFDRIVSVEYAKLEDGSDERHGNEKERRNAQIVMEERRKYEDEVAARDRAHTKRLRDEAAHNTSWAKRP